MRAARCSHTTTTGLNTLQLQFDRATGNVTHCWPTVVNTGNGWLVGYAAAAPNDDLGSMDTSARLPGTFRTNAANAPAITLTSTLPQLDTTVTMTATNYPSGSGLGVQALSFVRNDPGITISATGYVTRSFAHPEAVGVYRLTPARPSTPVTAR